MQTTREILKADAITFLIGMVALGFWTMVGIAIYF